MLLMILCCIGIITTLIKQPNKRTAMTSANTTTNPYTRIAWVVAISTIVYAILTIPKAIEAILLLIVTNMSHVDVSSVKDPSSGLFLFSTILQQIDVVLTAGLYLGLQKEFRKTMKDMFCKKIKRSSPHSGS